MTKQKRTANTHPFLLKMEFPAGHGMGLKSRKELRNFPYKTQSEAEQEKAILIRPDASFVSLKDRSKSNKIKSKD